MAFAPRVERGIFGIFPAAIDAFKALVQAAGRVAGGKLFGSGNNAVHASCEYSVNAYSNRPWDMNAYLESQRLGKSLDSPCETRRGLDDLDRDTIAC